MKNKGIIRSLCAFLALVFIFGMFTVPVSAGHKCPDCDEWIPDGDDYCMNCKRCESCCGFICADCGFCEDCIESESLAHCPDCMACGSSETLCYLCHRCESCGDWICENDDSCKVCHEENDGMCPECGENPHCTGSETCPDGPHCWECYEENYCEFCDRCLLCEDLEICEYCGACEECWDELHCPECGNCYEDVPQCEENGDHCIECCENNEWLCADCGRCTEGAGLELCESCGFCEDCWDVNEMHCEECGNCFEDYGRCPFDDNALHCEECCVICENCEECVISKGQDLCEDCGYCGDCCVCPKLDDTIRITDYRIGKKCEVTGSIWDYDTKAFIPESAWHYKWIVKREGETKYTVVSTTDSYTPVEADLGAYFRLEISVDGYKNPAVFFFGWRIQKELSFAGFDFRDYVEGVSTGNFLVSPASNTGYYVADSRFEIVQDPVRAGDENTLYITLKTKPNYIFANPVDVTNKNGRQVTDLKVKYVNERTLEITVRLKAGSSVIDTVGLNVKTPKKLKQCSANVVPLDNSYGIVKGSVQWHDKTDNKVLEIGKQFQEGHEYYVCADVYAKYSNGYTFAYDSYAGKPKVSATVNGYQAKVFKAYEQEPTRVLTVRYDFGPVSNDVIEEVYVNDLEKPVGGNFPDYTISLGGVGYSQRFGQGGYDNAYSGSEWVERYYTVNGITWYDTSNVNNPKVVYEDECFIPNHRYRVYINLEADEDYEFYTNKDWDVLVRGYVDNIWVTAEAPAFGLANRGVKLTYEFTCGFAQVDEIALFDLREPMGGEHPSFTLSTDREQLYTLQKITWFDTETSYMVTAEEFFEGGKTYQAEIVIVPLQAEGSVGFCQFKSPLAATLNGESVNGDIFAGSKQIYLYHTFTAAANPCASGHQDVVSQYHKTTDLENGYWEYYCNTCHKVIGREPATKGDHFPDLQDSAAWYYDYCVYCANIGVFSGNEKGEFNPLKKISRAELATVIASYLYPGYDTMSNAEFNNLLVWLNDNPVQLTDIAGKWYERAARLVAAAGIVSGNDKHQFKGEDPVTREQMAVMLYGAFGNGGYTFAPPAAFADMASVSGWAAEAVTWCGQSGLFEGDANHKFNPKNNATRAEVAVLFTKIDMAVRNVVWVD